MIARTETWRLQLLADDPWRRSVGIKNERCARSRGRAARLRHLPGQGEWDDRGPKDVMTVVEVTALDPAAERAMWEWLLGIDLVTQGRRLADTRAAPAVPADRRARAASDFTVGDGVWVRLVDLPAALEARSFVGPG